MSQSHSPSHCLHAVRGGLTLREAMTLLEDCHATGLVRAVDLVEVNTDLAEAAGDADLTLSAAKHVILASMGCHRSGTCQEV